jgi:surfactin synthase thioesterase subunit
MRTNYLYPYGGGSAASFRGYARAYPAELGQAVPVEIPGRGRRHDELHPQSIAECATRMLSEIETSGDYILHGHCMGALIAFETVKQIKARGAQLPGLLVVSGRNAPHHTNSWLLQVSAMDDRELFSHLQGMGGIPKGLSFAMAQSALAAIRQDQAMFSGYCPGPARIDIPILALAGRDDGMTNPDGLADWQGYTTAGSTLDWFDGGHYFLLDQASAIATAIDTCCAALPLGAKVAGAS